MHIRNEQYMQNGTVTVFAAVPYSYPYFFIILSSFFENSGVNIRRKTTFDTIYTTVIGKEVAVNARKRVRLKPESAQSVVHVSSITEYKKPEKTAYKIKTSLLRFNGSESSPARKPIKPHANI